MPVDLDDAARWRALAAESFRLASSFIDPSAKQTMLNIALGYEHIAQRSERRAAAKAAGKKRRPLDDGTDGLAVFLPFLPWLLN